MPRPRFGARNCLQPASNFAIRIRMHLHGLGKGDCFHLFPFMAILWTMLERLLHCSGRSFSWLGLLIKKSFTSATESDA